MSSYEPIADHPFFIEIKVEVGLLMNFGKRPKFKRKSLSNLNKRSAFIK